MIYYLRFYVSLHRLETERVEKKTKLNLNEMKKDEKWFDSLEPTCGLIAC